MWPCSSLAILTTCVLKLLTMALRSLAVPCQRHCMATRDPSLVWSISITDPPRARIISEREFSSAFLKNSRKTWWMMLWPSTGLPTIFIRISLRSSRVLAGWADFSRASLKVTTLSSLKSAMSLQ
uniref:Putative secreted protein n=1 Tax=Ixodes ricinus TaxID=34613 RepID=A0A6B0UQ61_IXORI